MADNTQVGTGTGDVVRDKDRAGVKTQIVGIDVAIGTGTESLLSASNPLPTTQPSSVVQSSNLTMTAAGNVVSISISSGASVVGAQITGTWTGTVAFEATTDGSTWFAINGVASVSGLQVPTATANGQWRINAGGYASVRVRSSVAGTGTAVVTLIGDPSPTLTTLAEPLPAGTNTIGNIGIVASSSFSMTTGTLSTATVPGNPNTASTTSAVVASVATAGNVTVYLFGGTYSALTLAFEVSPDGTNWFGINASRMDGTGTDLTPSFTAATIRGWEIVMPGVVYFRVRATAITQTAAPTVVIAPGGMVYDPSPVVTGTVALAPSPSLTIGTSTGTTPATAGQIGRVVRANANVAQTTAATLIAAPAAGTRIYVTNISCGNEGATFSVARLFAGSLPAAAGAVAVVNDVWDFPMAASGGGAGFNFPPTAPWALPAATALSFAVTVATTWAISVSYYVA